MQLDDLYREVIMDHYQKPRNQGELSGDARSVELRNPSCGDEIVLQLLVEDGVIKDVRFKGTGCSISMASASMMTDVIKGKTVAEANRLADAFREMVTGKEVDLDELGELESLHGVARFPARIKCATLAWQALDKATDARQDD